MDHVHLGDRGQSVGDLPDGVRVIIFDKRRVDIEAVAGAGSGVDDRGTGRVFRTDVGETDDGQIAAHEIVEAEADDAVEDAAIDIAMGANEGVVHAGIPTRPDVDGVVDVEGAEYAGVLIGQAVGEDGGGRGDGGAGGIDHLVAERRGVFADLNIDAGSARNRRMDVAFEVVDVPLIRAVGRTVPLVVEVREPRI